MKKQDIVPSFDELDEIKQDVAQARAVHWSQEMPGFLQAWLREPVLTPEEEVALAICLKQGDPAAYRELVGRNLRLVISILRRYLPHAGSLKFFDLFQEGVIGLHNGLMRFNPSRGYRISTYVSWWIRHAIGRAIADHGRMIRIPVHRADEMWQVLRASSSLETVLGREPTAEDVAAYTRKPVERVRTMLNLWQNQNTWSLDQRVDTGDSSSVAFVDMMPSHASADAFALVGVPAKMDDAHFLWLVARLDSASREMFLLKGLGWALQDIGDRFDLSQERIRQLLMDIGVHVYKRIPLPVDLSESEIKDLRDDLRRAREAQVGVRVLREAYHVMDRLRGRPLWTHEPYAQLLEDAPDPEALDAFVRGLSIEAEWGHGGTAEQKPLLPMRSRARITLKAPTDLARSNGDPVPHLPEAPQGTESLGYVPSLEERRIEQLCVLVEGRVATLLGEVQGLRAEPHDPARFPAMARALGRVEGLLDAACAELAALRQIASALRAA